MAEFVSSCIQWWKYCYGMLMLILQLLLIQW